MDRINRRKKENSPLGVMYVEVNDANFLNTGCYVLDPTGPTQEDPQPLFDIGIIFAANIKYDAAEGKAWVFLNENVGKLLREGATYIRPLQDKGIKVLLSILGGGEGQGITNFPSEAKAQAFAVVLASLVEDYGLDGIDFDDEYAEYGQHDPSLGQPNESSFVYLVRALRELMPDKIISFYFYGPAASRLTFNGLIAGDYLNYSWNAIYGTYYPPDVPGLSKSQVAPAAVNVRATDQATAEVLAEQTVEDGYGVYLYYALPGNDIQPYLSGIADKLYGTGVTLPEGCLRPWPENGLVGGTDKAESRTE